MASRSSVGLLGKLLRDTSGNTLAIMAAATFPLVGLVGGGVDMSRLYLAKTRLQQACDAGALAGRKVMGAGIWAANSNAANTSAQQFFDNNFRDGAWGTRARTRSFAESAGRVTGTASVTVPMTVMRVFRVSDGVLNVTCDAEMRLPNTDVMFVLDTTGSMEAKATSSDSVTKIVALRRAVKCFYESLARLDVADADCGPAPSGGTGGEVQIRFGFMPYATNVNVGRILPSSHIANSWSYQTRVWTGSNNGNFNDWHPLGSTRRNSSNRCNGVANGGNYEYRVTEIDDDTDYCYYERRWKNGPNWRYARAAVDVSGLKSGTSWNDSITLPLGHFRADKVINWEGCIEERSTVKQTNYNPLPAAARDLNINLVPTAGDAATQWGPALPGLIYARRVMTNFNQLNASEQTTSNDYYDGVGLANCPSQAAKLASYDAATTFQGYVNGMETGGNTYHDIGLLWGARFMSPTGIFAADNRVASSGGQISRHMIFMTDGDTQTSNLNYAAYGLPYFDRRQTDDDDPPTDGELNDQVNARTVGLCEAIKNQNITLWVISFGDGVNGTTNSRLRACSSGDEPDKKFYRASDAASLTTAFETIANQISQLRITS